MTSGTPREPLDVAAGRLLVENADGTCSVRIPTEGGRVVTVADRCNAWVIAAAVAAAAARGAGRRGPAVMSREHENELTAGA